MADYPDYSVAPSDIYSRKSDDVYGLRNTGPTPDTKLTDPSIAPTPDTSPTLNDHLLNLYGASMNTLAGVRRGIAQIQSDDDSRKAYDALADEANQASRDAFNSMTPSGQDTATKWNKHWIHGALMGGEQQLPMLVPAGAAEAIGGPVAAAAVYGGLSAGQAADSFYQAVAQAPSWQLERNPDYKALVDGGMSEADARQTFAHQHINDAEQMLVAGVTGAGVGYLGPAAKFFGRGLLGGTGQSALKSIAGGALESGTAMGLQTGLMDAAQAHALGALGMDAPSDEDILKSTGQSFLTGATIGAVGGGVGRIFHPPEQPPRPAGFRPEDIPRTAEGTTPADASGTRAAGPPPLGLPAPPGHIPGTIYAPDQYRPRPDGYGAYEEVGGGYKGRPSDIPPGQTPTPEVDAAKKAAAQKIHEEPVAGQASSIPGTGRDGLKPDVRPKTASNMLGQIIKEHQDAGTYNDYIKRPYEDRVAEAQARLNQPSTPSSPVADDQAAALDEVSANRSARLKDRHQKIKALSDAEGQPYQSYRGLSDADLNAKHSSLQAVKAPEQTSATEQPVAQPAAAQAQPSPKPDVTANLPLGGKPTPAGDFADIPEGAAPSEALPPDRDVERELARYDEMQRAAQQGPAVQVREAEREPTAAEPKLPAVKPPVTTVMGEALKPLLEKLQATRVPKEVKPLEERKGKNLTKAEKAVITSNNRRADQIVKEHPATEKDWLAWQPEKAGGVGATKALTDRLKAMVAAANDPKTGVKRPDLFIRAAPDALTHSPSVLVIDEAERLLNRFDKEKGKFHKEDIQRYIEREQRLTHPDMDNKKEYNKILEERSREAERMMAKTGKGPQAGVRQFKEGEEEKTAAPVTSAEIQRASEEEPKHKFSEPLPEPPSINAPAKAWADWREEFRDHPLVRASVNLPALQHLRPETMSNNELVGLFHDLSKVKAEIDAKMAGKQKGTLAEAVTAAEETKAKHAEAVAEPTAPIGKAAKAIATSKARAEARAAKAAEKQAAKVTPPTEGKGVAFSDILQRIHDLPDEKEEPSLPAVKEKAPPPTGKKAISFAELMGEPERESEGVEARLNDGTRGTITPHTSTTVRDLLPKVDPKIFPKAFQGMARTLINKIMDVVGDVPVHLVNKTEMDRLLPPGKDVDGLYDPKMDHIILDTDRNPEAASTTVFHEAFHAATVQGIHKVKDLMFNLTKLWKEVDGGRTSANPIEWLTYFMTDKAIQEQYKTLKISPELAKALDIPVWRKKTIFEGVLNTIRKALGFGPRDVGAIEAALAISEKAIAHREEAGLTQVREPKVYYDEENYYHTQVPKQLTKQYNGMQGKISKALDDEVSPRARGAMLTIKRWLNSPREWIQDMEKKGHFAKWGRQWLDHMSAQGMTREKILRLTVPIMRAISKLQVTKPEQFEKLADLLISSTIHGAHPDYELGEGKNSFIRVRDNLEDTNMDHWEAVNGGHAADRKLYLKELEEPTQKLYRDIRDAFETMNDGDIRAARKTYGNAVMTHMNRSEHDVGLKEATEKVVLGKKLTKDEQKKYGDDPNIEHLQMYDKMLKDATQRGPYFPLKRTAGKYVVTAKYDYKLPKGAVRDPDEADRIIFPDRASAYKFTGEVGLPSYRDTRHYWPQQDGTKKYTTFDDTIAKPDWRGQTTPAQEFHVVVNPHHVEFADSMAEGRKIQKAMLDAGVDPSSLSAVIPADGASFQKYGIHSQTVQAMMGRVDKLPYLNPDEKKAAQEAIEHVALSNVVGNRLSQNLLRRNRTAGASRDIIQAMDMRRKASAGFQAMAVHRDAIDEALENMRQEVKDKRTHDDADALQTAFELFRDRTINFQKDALSSMAMSKAWGHISQLATLKYLVSPAFLAYHQLHIPLVVVPRLANEIGWFPAFRVAWNTYKQMSGGLPIIGKGFKSAFGRAWDYDKEPIDFIDALRGELKKYGGTDDELAAIRWAEDHDLLHHTGISFSIAYKGMNSLDRLEQRSRNISQEIIGSADAINRFNSMLMFYRTARDVKGLRGEDAYRWATDRVAETQGQFSAFNRIEAFRNPNVRAVAQFKSFPLILMKTVTKALYNSLRWGASGEERVSAIKTLAGLMGASMALSGVRGAVPEPVEDINNMLSIFGLTNTWDTYEDKLRTMAADNMGGPEVSTMLMDGLGGALGVDLTHRGGISDLTGLTMLHAAKPQDMQDTFSKFLLGVPGAMVGDGLEGIGDMQAGNWTEALKLLVPRAITDPIKAYQLYNQGVTTRAGHVISDPVGLPDVLRRSLGFTTETESHSREARHATYLDRQELQGERANITEMWTSGDRGGAIQAMRDYNSRNPDKRMKFTDLQAAQRRAQRPTTLGYPDTPQDRTELEHRAYVYGLR